MVMLYFLIYIPIACRSSKQLWQMEDNLHSLRRTADSLCVIENKNKSSTDSMVFWLNIKICYYLHRGFIDWIFKFMFSNFEVTWIIWCHLQFYVLWKDYNLYRWNLSSAAKNRWKCWWVFGMHLRVRFLL